MFGGVNEFLVEVDRLGFGRILSRRNRIQRSSRFEVLQRSGIVGRFPRVRLQSRYVEFGLHVCFNGTFSKSLSLLSGKKMRLSHFFF